MGKLITDSWLGRMKSTTADNSKKPTTAPVGVVAFEIATLMSKTAALWHSLSDTQILRLRDDVLKLPGVRKLVSDDDDFLLGLALAETLDSLAALARSAARIADRRASSPVLRRLGLLFADLVKSGADPYGLQYAIKKMDRKVKKMERLAAATNNLYQEMEVVAELEQSLRRMAACPDSIRHGTNLTDFRQKVVWQRQEVKCLREVSLWNRTYDYTLRLLARSIFTIVARINHVFGFHAKTDAAKSLSGPMTNSNSSVHPSSGGGGSQPSSTSLSGPLPQVQPYSSSSSSSSNRVSWKHHRGSRKAAHKWSAGGAAFGGCLVGGNGSPVLQTCIPAADTGFKKSRPPAGNIPHGAEDAAFGAQFRFQGNSNFTMHSLFESRRKLLDAPPSTLGAAALALHYANVVVVIEKLVMAPHLIGPDARDDLYNMLTTSIRAALRLRLKSYAKNLSSSVYDPVLAAEWTEALTRILEWLSPLAHNMIKWQSERNFEQQHLVSTRNVRLLQTLYFANQAKAEAAITELLVGLNYLWRFARELNAKAVMECAGSRNYDDPVDSKG